MRPPGVLLLLLPFASALAAGGEGPSPRRGTGGGTVTSDISPTAQGNGGNITGWSTHGGGTDENPTKVNSTNYWNPDNRTIDTDHFTECDFHTTDNAHDINEEEHQFDHSYGKKFLELGKCCQKSEYFVNFTCKQKPGAQWENIENDYFNLPMNDSSTYWIPEILRHRHISAKYSTLSNSFTSSLFLDPNEENIKSFLGEKTSQTLLDKLHLYGHILPSLIKNHFTCFEATDDISRPLVLVALWKTILVNKCCRKSESWDLETKGCKAIYDNQSDDTIREVVDTKKDPGSVFWLPRSLQNNIIRVRYNTLAKDQWNVIIDADEEEWRFIPNDEDYKIWLSDSSGSKGRSPSFCFDSVHGQSDKHILAAEIVQIYKCCKNGEELNSRLDNCVPKSGLKIDNSVTGVLDLTKSNYWFPKQCNAKKMLVEYDYIRVFELYNSVHAFRADSINWQYVTSEPDDSVSLTLQVPALTNKSLTVHTESFCFDSVSSGFFAPHVIITWNEMENFIHFPKCCPRSEILNTDRRCELHDREDWSPFKSLMSSELERNSLYDIHYKWPDICTNEYNIHGAETPERHHALLTKHELIEVFSTKLYCADLLRNSDGSEQETLVFCEWPQNAWLYKRVRPLQVVAAALLGAAVVVAVARGQTRRTVHGRALACHAACLMASNALQAAWFFSHQLRTDCSNFAYAIYFFLVSSNVWLNVVSINMARGFSLQQAGRSTRSVKCRSWKLVGIYSFYAWGTSIALTATTVYMDINFRLKKDYVTPSFAETRTCFSEIVNPRSRRHFGLSDFQLGTLLYFYVPTGILMMINAICIIITMCKIRNLSRESSRINTTRRLQNALLYVKLLLTAGIAELAVEATVWITRKNSLEDYIFANIWAETRYAEKSTYLLVIILTFVDMARAAAVLWLCVGSWRMAARWLRQCVGRWLRRCASALSPLFNRPSRRDTSLQLSSSPNTSNVIDTASSRL